jgi:predicted MFS family arabinose efflux permease
LRSPIFLKNVICGGLIYSGEVVFLSITPFLIQIKLHFSSATYGWSLFFIIFGYIGGTSISSYFANQISCSKLILLGVFCVTVASVILLLFGIINYFRGCPR